MAKQVKNPNQEAPNAVRSKPKPKEQNQEANILEVTPVLQRDAQIPQQLSPGEAQNLQRAIGNQALGRLTLQRKMSVGPVGDQYEQEADAVAQQVVSQINTSSDAVSTQRQEEDEEMQMKPMVQRQEEEEEMQMKPLPSISRLQRQEEEEDLQEKPIQRQEEEEEEVRAKHIQREEDEEELQAKPIQRQEGDEEELQAKADPMLSGGEVSQDIETAVTSAKSGGSVLEDNVRQPMEQAFGADFSGVKIHTDSNADTLNRSLSARAFTTGQDIFFRQGEYNPTSTSGQELLAHELTHTVQQGAAPANQSVQPARMPTNGTAYGSETLQRWFGFGKKKKKKKKDKEKTNFSDFDSKQFRVSGQAPNRLIQEVKRTEENGQIVYYATGVVTGYKGKDPIITPYDQPISLGDWYPQVTHINGMAVAPKSGIGSAEALVDSINEAIGGDNDVAMGQEAVDVLYTYSAKRGGLFADLWDCIKGKVQVRDDATKKQEEIMLDAVHRKKRTTVSAHSRGTIKTDNAVRNTHEKLTTELMPEARSNYFDELVAYWEMNDLGIGLEPELLAEMSVQQVAKEKAKEQMNQYIQLIYAGNAVQYPSSILKFDMYVGGLDLVSMLVGTYSEIGRSAHAHLGIGGSTDSELHSVGKTKGHSFVKNYVPSVGAKIAEDIKSR